LAGGAIERWRIDPTGAALRKDSRDAKCLNRARAGPLAREVLMRRREVVALLSMTAGWPLAARAAARAPAHAAWPDQGDNTTCAFKKKWAAGAALSGSQAGSRARLVLNAGRTKPFGVQALNGEGSPPHSAPRRARRS
jgi:hypothetical protein